MGVVHAESRFGAPRVARGYVDLVNELVSSGELGIEGSVALSELVQDVDLYRRQARSWRWQCYALGVACVVEAGALAWLVLS
jgi:hypothetical protein